MRLQSSCATKLMSSTDALYRLVGGAWKGMQHLICKLSLSHSIMSCVQSLALDNYFDMDISLDSQERMLADRHRVIVLHVPPFLSLLQLRLGVPLHQSRQLLCLDLTASVGAINLIVLGRAVQSFDENGCVLYTCVNRRMQKQITRRRQMAITSHTQGYM